MGDPWEIEGEGEAQYLANCQKKIVEKIWNSSEIRKKLEKSDIFFYWKWSKMH